MGAIEPGFANFWLHRSRVFPSVLPIMRRHSSPSASGCVAQFWITGNFEGPATIDGCPQILEEGNTRRTSFNMRSHLLSDTGFDASIQILQ